MHDYDQSSNNSSAIQSDKLPIEILEPIKSFGLVEKLWQRAQPLAENVNDILMDHGPSTFKKQVKISIIHSKSAESYRNISFFSPSQS